MINFIYFKTLKLLISFLNFIYFLKSNKKENRLVNSCSKYYFSTTTKIIFRDNLNILKIIRENKVSGDFVECGVWKGISLVFLQKYIEIYNLKNTKVYGFDTFEGIPEPTKKDVDIYGNLMKDKYESLKIDKSTSGWNLASIDEVKSNFIKHTVPNENLILVKGKVEDTLLIKDNLPEKISLLKLDTSLYEGTKIELEALFPRVQKGGVVIVEGYLKFNGVRKAVDDYFSNKDFLVKNSYITSRATIYL